MESVDLQKKRVALALAVLVGVLTLFVMVAGPSISDTYNKLQEGEDYAREQTERYLDLAYSINLAFLETIRADWEAHKDFIDLYQSVHGNGYVMSVFIDTHIKGLINSAAKSVIIVNGNCPIKVFLVEEYKDLEIDYRSVPRDGAMHILNGVRGTPFGEGERFFVAGETFTHNDLEVIIYIGFLEAIMYDNFISTLNVEVLNSLRHNLKNITRSIIGLLVFISFYGFYVIARIKILNHVVCRGEE